jgi:quercetin dioxygenase-like cupin family protein
MKRALFLLAFLFLAASTAGAQDPLKVDPKHYKVIFENDQVRVLQAKYGPHEKSVMHEHPDSVAVFVRDSNVKFTYPDGKTEEQKGKAGQAVWNKAGKHLPENLGSKSLEVVVVELKPKPAAK